MPENDMKIKNMSIGILYKNILYVYIVLLEFKDLCAKINVEEQAPGDVNISLPVTWLFKHTLVKFSQLRE